MNNSTKNYIRIFYTESLEKLIQMKYYILAVDFTSEFTSQAIQDLQPNILKGRILTPKPKNDQIIPFSMKGLNEALKLLLGRKCRSGEKSGKAAVTF